MTHISGGRAFHTEETEYVKDLRFLLLARTE